VQQRNGSTADGMVEHHWQDSTIIITLWLIPQLFKDYFVAL